MAQFPISPKAADRGADNQALLAWSQGDIENRFGFKGGRYTSVNHAFAFLIGALLTGILYALMLFVFIHLPGMSNVATIYMRPSNQFAVIPATLFFFGGLAVLFLKGKKIKFQERALTLSAVPIEPEFVLTETSAATVLARRLRTALLRRDAGAPRPGLVHFEVGRKGLLALNDVGLLHLLALFRRPLKKRKGINEKLPLRPEPGERAPTLDRV
jgi:hypothetical protein